MRNTISKITYWASLEKGKRMRIVFDLGCPQFHFVLILEDKIILADEQILQTL